MKAYRNTGVYLRELYDALVGHLHQQLSKEGYDDITPSHGLIFQYLEETGSRITELAGKAGITKQSMSALVYQLEESGYLKRRPDPTDARALRFILTAKGQTLKRKAQQINCEFEKQWEQKLGATRYQRFREMLDDLVK